MAYSTPAMVRLALYPAGDGTTVPSPLSLTAADLTDGQLNDAIAEADALIDGYISKFYATPVAPSGDPAAIPRPVNYWSRTIAAYLATCTYRGSLDFTDQDPVYRRYREVLAALKDVAKGDMSLPLPPVVEDGLAGSGGASAPINPYVGDLFTIGDFQLQGDEWPGNNGGYTYPYWR